MAAELATSFLFGVTVAAAFGPIALLIVSHGMRDGFKPAAAAGLGAALADLAYAGVAFSLGAVALAALARYESALKLAAALALLGFGAWHAGRALRAKPVPAAEAPRVYAPLRSTFALTIVNPSTIVLFAAFSAQLPSAASAASIAAFGVAGIVRLVLAS